MTRFTVLATFLTATAIIAGGCSSDDDDAETSSEPLTAADGMSFFVTSQTNKTGNLGGISGADGICTTMPKAPRNICSIACTRCCRFPIRPSVSAFISRTPPRRAAG